MYSSSTYIPTQNTSSCIYIAYIFLVFFVSSGRYWGSTWKSTTSVPLVSLVIHHSLSFCRICFYIIYCSSSIFFQVQVTHADDTSYLTYEIAKCSVPSDILFSIRSKLSSIFCFLLIRLLTFPVNPTTFYEPYRDSYQLLANPRFILA
jgi:hypothetical protein